MGMNERREDLPEGGAVCRFQSADGVARLGWWDGGRIRDLSAIGAPWSASLAALLATGRPIGAVVAAALDAAPAAALDTVTLLAPIDAQEVWAAGVTYERSRQAREEESEHAADMYTRV